MMVKNDRRIFYEGAERRVRPINDRRCDINCLDHSGLSQRIDNVEEKIGWIDSQSFLTSAAYWWTTGILVSILMAILSASIYVTFQASKELEAIGKVQQALALKIDFLRSDIDQLKRKVDH